jgi:SPP1 gp7 family putative phage head morphogenesis protein
MKTLPAQPIRPAYWTDIERQLKEIFWLIVFKPVVDMLKEANPQVTDRTIRLANAGEEDLRLALRTGQIQYADGVFSGKFSSATSRALRAMGAKLQSRRVVFTLSPSDVPAWVRAEAGAYTVRAKELHDATLRKLDQVKADLASAVQAHRVNPAASVDAFQKGFKHLATRLEITPELASHSRAALLEDYTKNMDLWIQKFSEGMIGGLREAVEDNAMQGYRFDKLIGGIKSRYGVTTSKARFLARQETGLFMSKFRRERFSEAGVTHYKWSTSNDERVRNSHRALDGKIFAYADPPTVATIPKLRKANPGEDFNCRCVDIPILSPLSEAA